MAAHVPEQRHRHCGRTADLPEHHGQRGGRRDAQSPSHRGSGNSDDPEPDGPDAGGQCAQLWLDGRRARFPRGGARISRQWRLCAMTEPILEVRGLRKSYDEGRIEALRGVDLSIAAGEFMAISGPSGSGKSTLLQLLGGLDSPTSGQVLFRNTRLGSVIDLDTYPTKRDRKRT